MKTAVITALFTLLAFALFTGAAFGQTSDPSMFLAFGAGGSQYTDPHYAMTGSFGVRIAEGAFSVTSLDMSTKYDPATKKRIPLSTIRTGAQKRIAQQGPLGVYVSGDVGASMGGGNVVGALSGGGTLTYDIPKHPNLFVYGIARILKSPQNDPALANPATVQTAFAIGIGLKLGAK